MAPMQRGAPQSRNAQARKNASWTLGLFSSPIHCGKGFPRLRRVLEVGQGAAELLKVGHDGARAQ